MLKREQMHNYQLFGVEKVLENPYYGLLLGLGLGKTCTMLTAIDELMNDRFEVAKVLVIAPLMVADITWPNEIAKWEHLQHLTISKILGKPKDRVAALKARADIYVINVDNVDWLVSLLGQNWDFDLVVIDESSKFKNPGSIRFKQLKKMRPFIKRLYILTGTPAPNSLIDLWSQIWLLDMGRRLGNTMGAYKDKYFTGDKRNGTTIFTWKLREKSNEQLIYDQVADVCVSMKAKDYLKELPERTDQIVSVKMSDEDMAAYNDFEKNLVLQLKEAPEITAVNAAALMIKLRQFANGNMWDNELDKQWHTAHDAKLKAIEEDIEAAQGQPFLVFYQFRPDLFRLMDHFKKHKPRLLKSGKDARQTAQDWNDGKISLMFAHAMSAGHGLNLQEGGACLMGWYGLTWSSEEYVQAIARLERQGNKNKVLNRIYSCVGTVDELMLPRLQGKISDQDALLDAVKALINKY